MHAGTCATALCLLRSILGNRGHVTTSDSSVQQQLEMHSYLAQIKAAVPALVGDHQVERD
jgi:hypothetical protein